MKITIIINKNIIKAKFSTGLTRLCLPKPGESNES